MADYLKSLCLKGPIGASIVEPQEVEPLEEFRSRVSKIYPLPDVKLLAWLRARNLNVDKAEQMLRRHLIWRKNNEVGKLIFWESPKNFFPYLHSGFDREGTPVFILPIGQWDLKGSVEMGDMVPALKFIYQTLETLVSAGTLVNIHQGIVICDFDGFSYSQIAHRTVIQGLIETVRVFESNYPEILKAGYVINAPMVFNIVYALLKPLLHSRTLAKIQIFKSDPVKWKQVLLQEIDKSQLPPHWGGNRVGSDEYCSEAWMTGPLPPYFLRKNGAYFDDFGEEWYTIKMAAGEVLKFPYIISEGKHGGSVLSWAFYTASNAEDMDFVVLYEKTKSYLVEKRKVTTSESKHEVGSTTLREPGKYMLQFDNSWSKGSKTLHYSLTLKANEN